MGNEDVGAPSRGPIWKNPAWLTAFAGVLTALVAAAGLLVQNLNDDGDGGEASEEASTTDSSGEEASEPVGLPDVRTLAQLSETVIGTAEEHLPVGHEPSRYDTLESEPLGASVPAAWSAGGIAAFLDADDRPVGVSLLATPDEVGFYEGFSEPGIFVGVSESMYDGYDPAARAAHFRPYYSDRCSFVGAGDITGADSAGVYLIWRGCGSTSALALLYLNKVHRGYVTEVVAYARTVGDTKAIANVMESLEIDPPIQLDAPVSPAPAGFPGVTIP